MVFSVKKSYASRSAWQVWFMRMALLIWPILFLSCSRAPLNSYIEGAAPEIGKIAPENSRQYQLLAFWAAWCWPCIEAIPDLNRIDQEPWLAVTGISTAGQDRLAEEARKWKIEYRLLSDPGGDLLKAYNISYFPGYYLIDPDGNIIAAADRLTFFLQLRLRILAWTT